MHLFKAAMLLYQSSLERIKFREFERDTLDFISYLVKEPFYCTKGLYEMEN